MLGFFIDDGALQFLTETQALAATGKYGQQAHIECPRRPAAGAGHVRRPRRARDHARQAKKGKNYLGSTTGCKKKKHPFNTVLTFVDNSVDAPRHELTAQGDRRSARK